ncbi:hypothetical protein [Actinokineospora diospyrosa]|uniref:hypothetical protein n=1 Tax=Actinokineospora diospyrosa TaxID=103728 RepID=UPI0020A38795|nr:hypothetical protein [Actinokineospora diospyrosa]
MDKVSTLGDDIPGWSLVGSADLPPHRLPHDRPSGGPFHDCFHNGTIELSAIREITALCDAAGRSGWTAQSEKNSTVLSGTIGYRRAMG